MQAVVENDRQEDRREWSTQRDRTRTAETNGRNLDSKATFCFVGRGAEERPVALILCGVVVNIFTSEVVRRAVSWSASRRRGVRV